MCMSILCQRKERRFPEDRGCRVTCWFKDVIQHELEKEQKVRSSVLQCLFVCWCVWEWDHYIIFIHIIKIMYIFSISAAHTHTNLTTFAIFTHSLRFDIFSETVSISTTFPRVQGLAWFQQPPPPVQEKAGRSWEEDVNSMTFALGERWNYRFLVVVSGVLCFCPWLPGKMIQMIQF